MNEKDKTDYGCSIIAFGVILLFILPLIDQLFLLFLIFISFVLIGIIVLCYPTKKPITKYPRGNAQ